MAIASGSCAGKKIADWPRRAISASTSRRLGQFVAFLDADDVWLPGRLAKTHRGPAKAIRPPAWRFPTWCRSATTSVPLAPSYLHPGMARPPLMEDLLEEGWWPIIPSSVTIRRWVFDRVGGFRPRNTRAQPASTTPSFWFLLRELGDFAFVPEPLVNYRLDSDRRADAQVYAGLRPVRRTHAQALRRARRQARAALRGALSWLLTVKGLRCLEAGEMREARRALFCVLRYQPEPGAAGSARISFVRFLKMGRRSFHRQRPGRRTPGGAQGVVCASAASSGARNDAPRGSAGDSAARHPAMPASPKNCSPAGAPLALY